MADGNYDMLLDAIARNAGIVLSPPSAGMLRHHKSRFLSEAAGGFYVESVPGEARLVDSLILSQQPSGVSFKNGHLKVVFAAPIQRRAGVQFKALENNLDGRQTIAQLTRIVGELQREEVRRLRLGLCKAG